MSCPGSEVMTMHDIISRLVKKTDAQSSQGLWYKGSFFQVLLKGGVVGCVCGWCLLLSYHRQHEGSLFWALPGKGCCSSFAHTIASPLEAGSFQERWNGA